MSAAGPGQLRARSRPLLVLNIAGVRALLGLCLAWPLASLIADSGVGARPEGDRALFENGGYLLLEVARVQGPALVATARGLLPLLALGLLLNAVCSAALLAGLNQQGRLSWVEVARRALERSPALLVIGAGTGLAQLVLALIGSSVAAALPEPLARPVATTLGQAAVWLVVALLVGGLGGVSDVAKASLVRHEARLTEALACASRLALRRPWLSCFGWLPYALPFVSSAALAAQLSELCDVSRPGAWRVLVVLLAHQLVIVVAVAARAAWYARALRLTATHAPAA